MLKMLTKLFGLQTAATPAAVSKNIRYVTFRVDDEQAAAALHDWYQRRQDGLKTVQQYISDKFDYSLLKFNSPLFKLSEDGQLESVSYNGVIPLAGAAFPIHTGLPRKARKRSRKWKRCRRWRPLPRCIKSSTGQRWSLTGSSRARRESCGGSIIWLCLTAGTAKLISTCRTTIISLPFPASAKSSPAGSRPHG